jgi:NCS1 family nucleobase:cation symporter-1
MDLFTSSVPLRQAETVRSEKANMSTTLRHRLNALSEKLEVPVDENLDGERATNWKNRDLAPLPPSRRTWTVFGFIGFWSVIQLNVVGWQTASSLIALGLSVWEAMIVTIIAKVC